jgi:hypothetical protein
LSFCWASPIDGTFGRSGDITLCVDPFLFMRSAPQTELGIGPMILPAKISRPFSSRYACGLTFILLFPFALR